MLIIKPGQTLRVKLGSAQTTAPGECVTSWRDLEPGVTFAGDSSIVQTSGTSEVVLVPSPTGALRRVVDFVSLLNSDTANKVTTLYIDDGTTEFRIATVTLAPFERLEYTDQSGINVYSPTGAVKLVSSGVANAVQSGETVSVLAADVVNNNATANTLQNITGLSIPLVANNVYWFKFLIQYLAAATTTGSRFSINGPAFSELRYRSTYTLTTTTQTINESLSAYNAPAAANATSGATGSNIADIEGFIRPTVDGDLQAVFASEIANSAITARAGSFARSRIVL